MEVSILSKKEYGNGFTELVRGFFHHNPKSVNDMTNNSFFYYQFQLMTKLKSVLTVSGYFILSCKEYPHNTLKTSEKILQK